MLGDSLDCICLFVDLGVCVIQFIYNGCNCVVDGVIVVDDCGFSVFGVSVIEWLVCEGVLVDLSYSSIVICLVVLDVVIWLLVIIYSGCCVFVDYLCNKSDVELCCLVENGGVIGIYLMFYLCMQGQLQVVDFIVYIEYVLQICGEDYVGIGIDGCVSVIDDMFVYCCYFVVEIEIWCWFGIGVLGEMVEVVFFLFDFCGVDQFLCLVEQLVVCGYGEVCIVKILGGNFLCLF